MPPIPLDELERHLQAACGISLSEGIRSTLADAFRRAALDAGLSEAAFLARVRANDPAATLGLVEAAVVGETYFFRHPEHFQALRDELLARTPPGRPVAIWSAGCATGEEPYSLAMALLDAGRAGSGDLVLATDVSGRSLAVAREGVYGEWSLRRLDPRVRARHFEPRAGRLAVRDAPRALVRFEKRNLVKDPAPPGAFDAVFCRNVLIYFQPRVVAEVTAKLAAAVRPGGLLVLGPVETPAADALGLERREVGGVSVHLVPEGRGASGSSGPLTSALSPAARARGKVGRRSAGSPSTGDFRARLGAPTATATPTPTPIPIAIPIATPIPTGSAAPAPAFATARDAARQGDLALAESLAREMAHRYLCPESFLLLAMAAEARGDLAAAVEAVRRALYLEPGLAMAHAALVTLYGQLGLHAEAARARNNALAALEGVADAAVLRGVEDVTAGALRLALGGELAGGPEDLA
jgi:chemotaxis protein methyltransferase CheR